MSRRITSRNKKRRTQSLRWKAAAHERWTHRSPKSASTEPTFDGMRAFAPSLDLCDERPFDAMLALDDSRRWTTGEHPLRYSWSPLLAIAEDTGIDARSGLP